jgi:hypothetical protein
MLMPSLRYEISECGSEIACMACFVPTFERHDQQAQLAIDECPESTQFLTGQDLHFIFVVDRSGSMAGTFMDLTKQALLLFV